MPDVTLQRHSPLATTHFEGKGVTLAEASDFTLTQIAGDAATLKSVSVQTVLRITPKQFWVLGPPTSPRAGLHLTPLSSSRTRLHLTGPNAKRLLATSAAIDFSVMKPGDHVSTGIHHTPVLIHCIGDDEFHIYAMRTFAQSVWDWLVDAADEI
jgi:heterotetrameric sarcosine oxidase gamma subunit